MKQLESSDVLDKKSFILLISAGIFWGTSPLFVRSLESCGFSPWQMIVFRYGVSALIMMAVVLFCDKNKFCITIKQLPLLLISGIALYCTSSLYYVDIMHASPATAVALMYTSPAIITLLSVIFMGERFNLPKGFSVAASVLGSAFVAGFPTGMRAGVLGVVIGLIAAFAYSIYCIVLKVQTKKGYSSLTMTVYNFMIVAAISPFFASTTDLCARVRNISLTQILLIIGIGICTSAIPYFLYNYALKKLSVSVCSVLSTMEPMTATLFSVIFLGERLTLLSSLGIVLILSSTVVLAVCEKE